jgi:phenylacetic acid degradation operon negative regulatory protein
MSEGEAAVSVPSLCWALLRSDGTIRLSEVSDVGASLGLSEQAVRHGVRRLCEREGFVREGRGVSAIARVGAAGANLWELDRELVRFAYRQDEGLEPWDGRWRLISFSIPEVRRSDRDQLRTWLLSLGAAAISQGTYVSSHDWWDVVHPVVEELDVATHVSWGELDLLVVAGLSDPRAVAAHLWPAEHLQTAYAGAHARINGVERAWSGLDKAGRLGAWVLATISVTVPYEADPLLPNELAPSPGRATRAAYLALTERFLRDVPDANTYSVALEMSKPN